MAIDTAKPISQGPWPVGMNNRQAAHALPVDQNGRMVSLRNAVNVDLDNAGKPSRRQGFTKIAAATGAHSGFACEAGVFFMDGQRLKQLHDDDTVTDLGGMSGSQVAWAYANDHVYLSDGLVNKRITGGTLHDWGIPVPGQPIMHGVAGSGTFAAGKYLGAVTYIDVDGRESGACATVQADISANSAIVFANLPVSANADVVAVRIYMSLANGSQLFHAGTVGHGQASATISADTIGAGKPIATQFMSPMPPGRILREYKGRMLVASGPVVWISEPYAHDLVHRGRGFLQFPADVTVVEPVDGGVFVVADKTYFMAGSGPADWAQRLPVLDYGAVFGTAVRDRNNLPIWQSELGPVMGLPDGQAKNLTEAHVAQDSGTTGAGLYRERDGLRQFIASIQDPSMSRLAAQDWMDMEVIRRGATP